MKVVGKILLVMLIAITFPISVPILLIVKYGGGEPQASEKSEESGKDSGYNKIFPSIFTDENSSDDEKLLEDLYFLDLLNKENEKDKK